MNIYGGSDSKMKFGYPGWTMVVISVALVVTGIVLSFTSTYKEDNEMEVISLDSDDCSPGKKCSGVAQGTIDGVVQNLNFTETGHKVSIVVGSKIKRAIIDGVFVDNPTKKSTLVWSIVTSIIGGLLLLATGVYGFVYQLSKDI